MKSFFTQLVSATRGQGPSSTRFIYLVTHLAAVFCAVMMSIGGILVYCVRSGADAHYWWAVSGIWATTLGVGGLAKVDQQKRSKDLALGPPPSVAHAMSGD
ncbi:MAG TPA: hypothetical protein VMH85_18620 [Terriglobales bacterium]|nr:hypothetical protein [Terriglobales bacterium]